MKNLEMLLTWETHPSRRLYAYEDLAATRPRFNVFTGEDERPDIPPEFRWYIERNHFGLPVFMTGVALDDDARKKLGAEAIAYGMDQQLPDGSFPCSDLHHSAAFFFESLARFIALAERTGAGDVEPHKDCLAKGLTWFNRRSAWNDDWWRDTLHHRFFLNPASCFLGWELLRGRPDAPAAIHEQAYSWMAEGLRRQRPDGAHTEMGGQDTGYHSCSILYGAVVLMTCELHPDFAGELRTSLRRAADWLLPFVGDDGAVDGSLNARTGPMSDERNRETGKPKDPKPYETAFALYGAGLVLEDDRCIETADRVVRALT